MGGALMALDPGNLGIVCTASATLAYAAVRSTQRRSGLASMSHEHTSNVRVVPAFVGVLSICVGLTALFYLVGSLVTLVDVIFALTAMSGLLFCVYPHVAHCFSILAQREFVLPLCGPVPILLLVLFPLCAFIVVLWFFTRSLILNDILCIAVCVFLLNYLRLSSVKMPAIFLLLIFLYDLVWIIFSDRVFGRGVLMAVSTEQNLPVRIEIPLFLHGHHRGRSAVLGLGEIVLPGLLLVFLTHFDRSSSSLTFASSTWRGYFAWGWMGYTGGLVVWEVVSALTSSLVPPMLFLSPFVLVPTFLRAWKMGEVWKMVQGFHQHDLPMRLVDEADLCGGSSGVGLDHPPPSPSKWEERPILGSPEDGGRSEDVEIPDV